MVWLNSGSQVVKFVVLSGRVKIIARWFCLFRLCESQVKPWVREFACESVQEKQCERLGVCKKVGRVQLRKLSLPHEESAWSEAKGTEVSALGYAGPRLWEVKFWLVPAPAVESHVARERREASGGTAASQGRVSQTALCQQGGRREKW